MAECQDRDCRDGIYTAIGKVKDKIEEKVSTRTVLAFLGLVGVLLTIGYFASATGQEAQNKRIAEITTEVHAVDKVQERLITQMENYKVAQQRLEKKMDQSQRLLIEIGTKMGIENDIDDES